MEDFARFCCANVRCSSFGQRNAGNLSVHDRFGKQRQYRLLGCNVCQHTFSGNQGTVLFRASSPTTRWWRFCATSRKDSASGPRHAWWESTATPLSVWPAGPAITPTTLMTSSWLFPPPTREVQCDEKWAFVGKKQTNFDRNHPDDDQCGDYWDFVAFAPEHRLVLAVIPGAWTTANAQAIVEQVKERTGEAPRRC